jgi:hypothetical protein
VADFRDSTGFARLVAVFVERATAQGWPIDAAHAAVLLGDRISRVAALTRRAPTTVVRDYHARDVIAYVDAHIAAGMRGTGEAADDRPIVLPAGGPSALMADLASVTQVAAHNADLDTVDVASEALRSLAGAGDDGFAASAPPHALALACDAFARARHGIASGWRIRGDAACGRGDNFERDMDEAFKARLEDLSALLGRSRKVR